MGLSVPARPTAQDPTSPVPPHPGPAAPSPSNAPAGPASSSPRAPGCGALPRAHIPARPPPLPDPRVPNAQGRGCPTASHHSCPAPGRGGRGDGSPRPPWGPDAASPTHFVYRPHSCTQLICLQVVMSWRGCGRLRRAPQASPRNTVLEKGAPNLVSSGTENKCKYFKPKP